MKLSFEVRKYPTASKRSRLARDQEGSSSVGRAMRRSQVVRPKLDLLKWGSLALLTSGVARVAYGKPIGNANKAERIIALRSTLQTCLALPRRKQNDISHRQKDGKLRQIADRRSREFSIINTSWVSS
jgi:hypothetical protein